MKKIKVSVIIPAYNEERYIEKCLASLRDQSYKDFEVIIVDDGSTDKTKEIVSEFKEAKLIIGQHKGPGFSRNLGSKDAKGDILIFVDSDMTFEKDYIKNLIKPFDNKSIIGTTHEEEIATNTKNIWSRCWGRIRVSKEDSNSAKIYRAIRKNKFFDMGGFDPSYGYADDQTFWFKYKVRPVVANNTICYHQNAENLKEVYKQSRWIGASIELKLYGIKGLNYIIPFLMILISPFAIILLSVKKSVKNKDLKILFPWMIIFMFFRYFGTISGLFRKNYLKKNFK